MKKWALGAFALLVVVAAAAWWFFASLDWLVKHAIETRGSEITGTSVTVSGVRISARDGRGSLSQFTIGNPPGFTSPHAFHADAIEVTIDPATLASDIPVVWDVIIDAPDVIYESSGKLANLEVLQRHIDAAARGDAPAAKGGAAAKPPRRFVIDRILIRKARVSILNPVLKGGAAHFVLPDVELRGLGAGGHGVTAAEAARQVVAAMSTKIAINAALSSDVLKKGFEGALDSLFQRRK